jgi:hypothetical protein
MKPDSRMFGRKNIMTIWTDCSWLFAKVEKV